MKILYDHQIFSAQRYGGISSYFSSLISQILLNRMASVELGTLFSSNANLATIPNLLKFQNVRVYPDIKFPRLVDNSIVSNINQLYSNYLVKGQNFDLFHPTYYNPYFLNLLRGKPYVVTVYDMIHELFPSYFPGDQTTIHKRLILSNAAKIIAISERTKGDLIQLMGISESCIEVVPLSLPILFDCSQHATLELPRNYVLYVGNRGLYKNFKFLLAAWRQIKSDVPDLKLLCFGGGIFSSSEQKLISGYGLSSTVQHITTSDSLLSKIYRRAIALVVPSLYEGFGLPVLEAFKCCCPCILSSKGALPEVAGDAATYFDPLSTESIVAAIEQVVNSESRRRLLISLGETRLNNFSIERTASATLKIYEAV